MAEPKSMTSDHDPIEPDEQAIATRAYFLSRLPNAGTDEEDWERARLELRKEQQLSLTSTRKARVAVLEWIKNGNAAVLAVLGLLLYGLLSIPAIIFYARLVQHRKK
jgi:hypothetical protein